MFRQELVNLIDMRHALVKLAQTIDWSACEKRYGGLYAAGVGRLAQPVPLMFGLQLLKQMANQSDELAVATWVEIPYRHYFCGEQDFQHQLPINPSLIIGHLRNVMPAVATTEAEGFIAPFLVA